MEADKLNPNGPRRLHCGRGEYACFAHAVGPQEHGAARARVANIVAWDRRAEGHTPAILVSNDFDPGPE